MAFNSDDYLKLRKKRLQGENNKTTAKTTKTTTKSTTSGGGFSADEYLELRNKRLTTQNNDIAPVKTTVKTALTQSKKKEDSNKRSWFQKGAFEDGYQFGDITKTILGSAGDVRENLGTGVIGMGEKIVDAASMLGAVMNRSTMNEAAQNEMIFNTLTGKKSDGVLKRYNDAQKEVEKATAKFVQKDLYDEEKVAKKIITAPFEKATGINVESNSVYGEKTDALVQSGGQLLATAGLQTVGVPWWLTTGATTFGSESEAALNEGASFDKAVLSSTISAGAEILTEKLSGGIKFGGKTLDDVLLKPFTEKISNKAVKTLVNLGVDAGGEGLEEIISQVFSNLGTSLYKEESISELLLSEEAMDEYIESFIGGAVLGGISSGGKAISNGKKATFTENEQKVIDKEFESRIAEEEKDGSKLTKIEKAKIYKSVVADMEKGYIDTDKIESVLGGETYNQYKSTTEQEKALQEEFDALNKMKQGDMTGEQIDRRAELKQQLKELKNNSNTSQLKEQLSNEVLSLAKDSRLAESYNEKARRSHPFEADLSKYDTKQAEIVKKAVESGILNNTNRTHEFVDMVAKISADKGVLFDFTNNTKLKESGFAVEGKTVNGYVTKDGNIAVNIDSNKSLNSVVGHEITHILEGTELYTTLQSVVKEYATTKGEYNTRIQALSKLYEGVEGANIENELTADLIGDYLFTDSDFVKKLSVEHRNIFQKIYDEIKYLCKIATAGSKEARQLEKVKKAFEDAYRGTTTKKSGNNNYSLSLVDAVQPTTEGWQRTLTTDEAKARFPKLWDVTADESEVRNPTQISSTVRSYRKVYDYLKNEGFDGTILDASSGLGFGTKAGIEEYGFDVEDIEPYPDENYNPKYRDYSTLNKKYDVVISNAVLNVLPQDQRDALVVKMGQMLNDGGRIFINVRGKDVDTLASNKNNTNISPMEWFVDSTGSYQKGFTKPELVAYLKDALGDGFTVKPTNMFGAVSVIVTKESGAKYSLSAEQEAYFKDSVVRDDNGDLKVMYHGTSKGGHTVFDTFGESRFGLFGAGAYFTDNKSVAESYTKKGRGNNPQVYESYLNITNPIDMDAKADIEAWKKAFPDADYTNCATNEDCFKAMKEVFVDEEYPLWEAKDTALDVLQYNMGYDGITHIGGGRVNADGTRHRVYIAFEPEQIKNIDNTKPTGNPDIRYSLSDSEGNTLTKEQADYFKNSKAVDNNGNLLKVYHTTNRDFTVFDKSKKGEATQDANTYLGFFFSDDAEYMQNFPEFKDGKTESYYLNMTNPIDMTNISKDAFLDIVEVMGGDVTEAAEVYDDAGGGQLGHLLDELTGEFYYNDFIKELQPHYDELMSKGYDGVIGHLDEDYGAKEYIVLDSNQAKLTSNTKPTADADIRYSLSSDSDGRELSTEQQNYFKNSKAVDENGSLKLVYHGTRKADFTIFKRNVNYFTDSKEMADSYAPNGEMFEGYLNITKPYEIDAKGEKWSGVPIDEATANFLKEYGASVFKEKGELRTTPADIASAIEEAIENGDADYDGIIIKNIDDTGSYYKGNEKHLGTDYIVFNSNQFKAFDNKTPTTNADIRYSLSEADNTYLSAVKNGDTDTAQMLVEEAAKKSMPNSKVVDENGNLLTVYHGSASKFTVFNHNKMNAHGNAHGRGFYFTENKSLAEDYEKDGGQLLKGYLNIEKPLSEDKVTIKKSSLIKLIQATCETEAKSLVADGGYDSIQDAILDAWVSNYVETYSMNIKDVYREVADIIYSGSDNDVDIIAEITNGGAGVENTLKNTNKVLGYDGVIYTNPYGTHEFVSLISNQFKSTEAVTYDDNGNVIPLSQRFNLADEDIRYSLSAENEQPIKQMGLTYGEDIRLIAPIKEDVTSKTENTVVEKKATSPVAPVVEKTTATADNTFPDNFAPITEEQANEQASKNLASLTDADIPPVVDSQQNGENNYAKPEDPFYDRDIKEVGNRKVKAYMYENPEVKSFFQEEANVMLSELQRGTKGEKIYTETDGKGVWNGTTRSTSDEIAYLLDECHYTYAQIEKGLKAIIEDNGAENNACSKRIEFVLNDRLLKGYTDFESGIEIPPNQDYVNLLNEKQITEYNEEASKRIVETDNLVPSVEEKAKTKRKRKASNVAVKRYIFQKPSKRNDGRPNSATQGAKILDGKQYMSFNGRFVVELNTPDESIPDNEQLAVDSIKGIFEKVGKDIIKGNYEIDAIEISRIRKEMPKGASRLNLVVVGDSYFDINYVDAVLRAIENPTISLSKFIANTKALVIKGNNGQSIIAPVRITDTTTLDETSFVYKAEKVGAKVEDIAPTPNKTVAPVTEDIAPIKATKSEAIKPAPEKLQGEEAEWAKNKMARADKVGEETTAKILTEEPKTEKKKRGLWSYVKESVLDKGMVFESLSKKTKNRELEAKWNFIRYADGNAQRLIGKGTEGVKSLKDIQAEVEETGLTKEFYEYLYHKHNVDRMNLEERYNDIKNKPVFSYSVTSEASQDVVNQYEFAEPRFKEYAQDVYNYMNYLRNMMVDNGVISQETADLWAEMYPHYVPIRRVGDTGLNVNVPLDTGRTSVNAPVKAATGGSRDILPLFDTMAQRTMQTYKAVAKNSFGVELKNTLGTTIKSDAAKLDDIIDGIDTQDDLLQEGKNGNSPTFTVFENGERVTFEITDEMYDALKPKSEKLAYRNKFLNTMSNIQRGLLTEYNPVFMLTNAVKDAQDVLVNSQHALKTYANFPKAIAEMVAKGEYYTEYMSNGGEQNTYFDNDSNTFTEDRKGIKKVIGIPLDIISGANNVIERLPRLAEYIASRKSGRSVEVSMLDAARVTTNFAAGGDVTKFLNGNGCTFLSASVNGAVQQVRNIQEAKMNGLKGWVGLATKFALAGLPAMMLNHLLWDDDEEYEELSDYVKENYYVVAKRSDGTFVRIPKGRTLAVIQNAMEQIKNAATGDDEVDLKSFLELAISNLAPNNPIDNNVIAPFLQVANNKTWYGEDLVPTRLQDLPAAEQFDESTDEISKWLGEKLNYSPYKINYLLNQISGGVGDVALPMLTPEAESGDNSLVGNFIAPLKDKFTTDGVMKNQNISDFYDTVDELTTNAKSSKATDEDILRYKYMNSVNTELGEMYKQKREIQNGSLPDDEKYSAVRKIQEQINALAKENLNTYNNVVVDNSYATVGDRHYRVNNDGEWEKITDKQLEKQKEVVSGLGISASDYWSNKEEYDYAYEYPEKYALSKAVGGYKTFKTYSSELYDIKADKDSNGKSISGSRKEKVLDYINNLNIDYYEKIILFKSEYNADDRYNYEIIDYLNNRDDITYSDMVLILKELGFTVDAEGNISWD